MKLKDLGYRIIVIDEEAIGYLLEKVSIDELEDFSEAGGKVYVIGESAKSLKDIVYLSGGDIVKNYERKSIVTDVTTLVRNKKHKFLNWSEVFKIEPKLVKSIILYINYTDTSVLTDLPTFFKMKYSEYIRKKDCYLRLIAHGMENCPHNCVYCYANYSYDVPTTVLINFKNKIKKDIKKKEFSDLIKQGFPINIGSITDPFSKVAVYFGLVKDFLETVGDIRTLMVTKSIYFTEKHMIDFLKRFKNLKITFTYTGLYPYELGIPYNNTQFPKDKIANTISSGLDVNIFYRPILQEVNDDKSYMETLFREMKDSGIKHVCFGFMRNNVRMEESLSERFPNKFKEITANLTHKYMDDFYPSLEYRLKKAFEIHNILYHLDMHASTCQPYVGKIREIIETIPCSCRKERWEI